MSWTNEALDMAAMKHLQNEKPRKLVLIVSEQFIRNEFGEEGVELCRRRGDVIFTKRVELSDE